jgi:peptidoglycan/LPS O-acetylase OafA/YrhL
MRDGRESRLSFGYLRGLDGVRGIALIIVMLIHSGLSWMHGGLFGLDIFFVLSGFLITSLLLQEYDRNRSISLRDYWIRRSLRILPALAVVLVAVTIFSLLALDGIARSMNLESVVSAATYTSNWVVAFTENRGNFPVMMGPTWSLAIEMQFYLLWPLVVIATGAVLRRFAGAPSTQTFARALLVVAGVLAGAVMLWRAAMTAAGWDWWRLYGGTDTHVDGLLVGCALACIVALGALRRWPAWLGVAGLAVIVVMVALGSLEDRWVALYGFTLISLSTAALIGSVAAGQWISRPLGWTPFVFLGRVSYGTYLWHLPVLLGFVVFFGRPGWVVPVTITVALTMGTLSFYVVERPALRLKRRFERSASGRAAAEAQTGTMRDPEHHHAGGGAPVG